MGRASQRGWRHRNPLAKHLRLVQQEVKRLEHLPQAQERGSPCPQPPESPLLGDILGFREAAKLTQGFAEGSRSLPLPLLRLGSLGSPPSLPARSGTGMTTGQGAALGTASARPEKLQKNLNNKKCKTKPSANFTKQPSLKAHAGDSRAPAQVNPLSLCVFLLRASLSPFGSKPKALLTDLRSQLFSRLQLSHGREQEPPFPGRGLAPRCSPQLPPPAASSPQPPPLPELRFMPSSQPCAPRSQRRRFGAEPAENCSPATATLLPQPLGCPGTKGGGGGVG